VKGKGRKEKGGFTWRSNFVGHIGEELGLGSVCKFSSLSRSSVSLNAVPKIEHHLIDFSLQLVHFSRSFNRNELGEVAVGCGVGDIAKSAYLSS